MWMKVDDGLHAHRKTRAVTASHPEKRRDAAAMGLWVLAGSWSARNNRDGWVPAEELDRFDDAWEDLAKRLVHAGYWWPEDRDGESGYGFNDWQEWNNPDGASVSGTFGNHVRWHVQKGVVKPGCEHCPTEPDDPMDEPDDRPDSPPIRPDDRPDIAPESGGDIAPTSGANRLGIIAPNRLPVPDPTRTRPVPEDISRASALTETERFDEFWDTYDKKVDRKKAEVAYRNALKKPGVTADLLVAAAAAYITWQTSEGKHPQFTKHPTTWLHGENWRDERVARAPTPPLGRVGQHMQLVRQLAEQEQQPTIPQIGPGR